MFSRFLPTLSLKKQQIQSEILKVRSARAKLEVQMSETVNRSKSFQLLFSESLPGSVTRLIKIKNVKRSIKNVAGIKLPTVSNVECEVMPYSRLYSPVWVDKGVELIKSLFELKEQVRVLREQEAALQFELRKVTQRVNLFEKVKIPQSKENIRVIRISLAEEQTSAVARSKIAKGKAPQ